MGLRLKSKSKPRRQFKVSLQFMIIILVVLVIIISLIISLLLIRNFVINKHFDNTKEKLSGIAKMVASDNDVIRNVEQGTPVKQIQDYSLGVMHNVNVDFVVILNHDLIRLSHPNATMVGKPFSDLNDARRALSGQGHFSENIGILGKGYRYFTPIFNQQHEVIGIVCVGLTMRTLNHDLMQAQYTIFGGLMLGLFSGVLGAIILAQKIKTILFGLEPQEIATRLREKEIIENEVAEGIIAISADKKIMLMNKEAQAKYQLANQEMKAPIGEQLDTNFYNVLFKRVFDDKKKIKDRSFYVNGIEVIATVTPIYIENEFFGAVATLRDQSEMIHLSNQLSGTKYYINSLRGQTHEFMNKMHVISGLIEMRKYAEVSQYIQQLNHRYQDEVGFLTERIKVPALAGFIMGKINEAREQNISVLLAESSNVSNVEMQDIVHDVIHILGNFFDNAIDSILQKKEPGKIELKLNYECEGNVFILKVKDNGLGIDFEMQKRIFEHGFSTKGEDRGYGLNLVKTMVENHQGIIELDSQPGLGTSIYVELPCTLEVTNE
ncbi:ATP-binding protein [Paenibacillus sp. F4]|uniref:ATP-binding protein n=1 Tax=Paenibacillus sp. F4 TaxID=357385 RepID=UPI0011AF98FA|nr:ATP-binding protein [Paenibacillus sp. F4]